MFMDAKVRELLRKKAAPAECAGDTPPYHCVSIPPDCCTWLGFEYEVNGVALVFQWEVCLFGVNVIPFVFATVTKCITTCLRALGLNTLSSWTTWASQCRPACRREPDTGSDG